MSNLSDQEFLDIIIKNIVSHPEDVKIDRTVDEMGVLLTLKVNPVDMGQIIGRSGQTARAIRTLLRTIGAKLNARLNLKIQEPEGSTRANIQQPAAPVVSEATSSDIADLNL